MATGTRESSSRQGAGWRRALSMGKGRAPATRDLLPTGAPWCLVQPASGTSMSNGLDLFHDAHEAGFTCAGTDNPSAFRLTCYQFDGSYLSLVAALTPAQVRALRPGRTVRLSMTTSTSRPTVAFGRLNLKTAEQTEVRHTTLVLADGDRVMDFSVDAYGLAHAALTAGWLDVIFSDPGMCELTFTRLALEVGDP